MVREQGRQPTEAAKELGICIDTLRSWLKRRLALSGNRKRPVYQEDCGVRILRACLRSLGGSTRSWRLRPWKWHTAAASLQKAVPTRSAAQCDVFAYLESFYNTRRPRSALGWIPHSRFEEELCHSVA